MKVAEYNSIAEAPGVMNKDAEDNSIAEILGDDIFCDSILLFCVSMFLHGEVNIE